MAKIEGRPQLDMQIVLVLNEQEARALEALAGYGTKEFLEAFYEKLGKAYLKPHADGIVSLFQAIKENLPAICSRADQARKAFYDPRAKVYIEERPPPPLPPPSDTTRAYGG